MMTKSNHQKKMSN